MNARSFRLVMFILIGALAILTVLFLTACRSDVKTPEAGWGTVQKVAVPDGRCWLVFVPASQHAAVVLGPCEVPR